jgi:hypothetical protein
MERETSDMGNVTSWIKELDALLRWDKDRSLALMKGTRPLRAGHGVASAVILGCVYGLFMGLYALLTRRPPCWEQMLVTAVKVPALFLLTLFVTFPSLYVFSALLGTRLSFLDTLRVLVGATAVSVCVLAAFGPITGFFTISTTSYPFMKILNVLFFAIAGFLGIGFLAKVFRLLEGGEPDKGAGAPPSEAAPGPAQPADPAPSAAGGDSRSGSSCMRSSVRRWVGFCARSSARRTRRFRYFELARRMSSPTSCGRSGVCSVDARRPFTVDHAAAAGPDR